LYYIDFKVIGILTTHLIHYQGLKKYYLYLYQALSGLEKPFNSILSRYSGS